MKGKKKRARMSHGTQPAEDNKLNLLQFGVTLVLLYRVPFLCIAVALAQREQRNQHSDV